MPRIHVFPQWKSNPYLNMLYVGAIAEGWEIGGSRDLEGLFEALLDVRPDDIVHIHWTSPILQRAPDRETAIASLKRFRAAIDAVVRQGAQVIWTVHNIVTHDARYPSLEVSLAKYLARVASRIIQLNPSTKAAVEGLYDLPLDKLVTLPHASYADVYPTPPPQDVARKILGVPLSSPTVGFVGQIRAYKGVPILVEAIGNLAASVPDLSLLLAGRAETTEREVIEKSLPTGLRAIRKYSFVPDEEIGTWFAAADVIVLPYRRILNAGSVLLAATFGRPCVLPAEPHLEDLYGSEPWVSFFATEGDIGQNLAVAIRLALETGTLNRKSAIEYSRRYRLQDMAWDYVEILDQLRVK